MSSILYIILGLFITFTAYFLIAWGMSSLFFFISREKVDIIRDLKVSAALAAAGMFTTFAGMICFSSLPIYLFSAIVALVGFGIYFGTLKLMWKFKNFDAAVMATSLAIILNPGWLHLVGII